MKKVAKLSMLFVLLLYILCGCSQTKQTEVVAGNESNTEQQMKANLDLMYPVYQNLLLTDLCNCDLTFMKGMMGHDFEANLYSIEHLDADKIEVSFDSDIKYDVKVKEVEAIQRDAFGYTLFCAYNDKGIEKYGDLADGISFDDYTANIAENEEIPAFYTYQIYVNLKTEEEQIENFDDLEINTMTVSYKGKEYDFDIGTIKFEPKMEFKEKFAEDLAGQSSAKVKTACQNYIPLDNTCEGFFEIDLPECLLTEKKEMTITSIGLSNADGIGIEKVQIRLANDEQSMDMEYKEGDELTIPQNTLASIKILGQMDSLKNKIGGYCSVSVDVGYKIDGEENDFQYQILAKGYMRTPYEIYAYQVDGIDIFDFYLNKISYYDVNMSW